MRKITVLIMLVAFGLSAFAQEPDSKAAKGAVQGQASGPDHRQPAESYLALTGLPGLQQDQ